ncbi:MAG: aminopeptidase P family protein [Planctomycetota bacterium]|nr:aminopeptidase P family protein [Planctomycetota bacterium]
MLTLEGCRARQKRLLELLAKQGLDGALITSREHVYYFTNFRAHWNHASAALIEAGGKTTVLGWKAKREDVAASAFLEYPAHKFSTMPMNQTELAAAALATSIPGGKRLGVDLEGPAALARLAGPDAPDLTSAIHRLRKRKDGDEISALRRAIAVTEAMYAWVKKNIQPGLDELDFYAGIRGAAIAAAHVDPERFGNDFRAAEGGGTPRRRRMNAGELFVLDSGPSIDGYHADNCRTFAVDRKGTDAQHKACEKIVATLAFCEGRIKPGLSAQQLFADAKQFLADAGHSGLCHHLGHGIGLQPHEAPQLNPEYDAVFEAGDVFTMEPGLYSKELNAGIRLEQDYLLTERGLERLTEFPLGLA